VIRPRKRFGQHFLHDPAVVERIVSAVAPRGDESLVEIGPGRGALTSRLLERAGSLDAVEIDRDLAAKLREQLGSHPAFHLHEADALEFDYEALAGERGRRLRVVGNLPYNISTPLLFRLLAQRAAIVDLHVMLQREVVDRIVARPGGGEYGRLTVMLAPWFEAQRLFDVGPGAFSPPPEVWSSVLRLRVRAQPAFETGRLFGEVVAAAFAQRRKQLRNSLAALLEDSRIEACGIDPRSRPERLAPEQFAALARAADAG
jgi:16S rRNA (adenine1518-N6/adenine1519-N6)-dimethyltransferase